MARRLKPGSNPQQGGELTKEVFQGGYADLVKLKADHRVTVEDARRANSAVRDHRKYLKRCGVNLEALDVAGEIAQLDPDQQRPFMNQVLRYLAYMNAPAGREVDLFDVASDGPHPVDHNTTAHGSTGPDDRALHAGAIACGEGLSSEDNPHQVGTTEHKMWAKGFADEMADRLGGETKASAPPKRGRPPKANGAQAGAGLN